MSLQELVPSFRADVGQRQLPDRGVHPQHDVGARSLPRDQHRVIDERAHLGLDRCREEALEIGELEALGQHGGRRQRITLRSAQPRKGARDRRRQRARSCRGERVERAVELVAEPRQADGARARGSEFERERQALEAEDHRRRLGEPFVIELAQYPVATHALDEQRNGGTGACVRGPRRGGQRERSQHDHVLAGKTRPHPGRHENRGDPHERRHQRQGLRAEVLDLVQRQTSVLGDRARHLLAHPLVGRCADHRAAGRSDRLRELLGGLRGAHFRREHRAVSAVQPRVEQRALSHAGRTQDHDQPLALVEQAIEQVELGLAPDDGRAR